MGRKDSLVTDGLFFSYGEKPAIRGVSVEFVPGKFIGVVGPNGCGKSTLLDLLVGIKTPTRGRVLLDGEDVRRLKKREVARKMALVPQKFFINFPFTVHEVLLMGRHPYIPRFSTPSEKDYYIVNCVAEQFELTEFLYSYITELSGGEIQRVVVARAVVQDTPFLLLDEATSNMDIKHTLEIFTGLRKRVDNEGITVISVMHDLSLAAMFCDEVVAMKNGKIHDHGDARKTLSEKNINEVFEVRARVVDDDEGCGFRIFFNGVSHD